MFAFPEVALNNKFEKRENYHRITLNKAFAIFVESEQSKKELIKFERINKNRIFEVPLFPGKVVELEINKSEQDIILKKWNISKNQFYFYPAQFWAHKNHFVLIMAFKKVLNQNPSLKLILSGSDKGNLNYIKSIVNENKLQNNVIFTGFVGESDIYTFYKNAIALVMPTYLGPTNMPLLEANQLGCKVLCTNLKGHKEQMNDNSTYFDASNFDDIAEKMIEVIESKAQPILKQNEATCEILNSHFLSIFNFRKTFGYEF